MAKVKRQALSLDAISDSGTSNVRRHGVGQRRAVGRQSASAHAACVARLARAGLAWELKRRGRGSIASNRTPAPTTPLAATLSRLLSHHPQRAPIGAIAIRELGIRQPHPSRPRMLPRSLKAARCQVWSANTKCPSTPRQRAPERGGVARRVRAKPVPHRRALSHRVPPSAKLCMRWILAPRRLYKAIHVSSLALCKTRFTQRRSPGLRQRNPE